MRQAKVESIYRHHSVRKSGRLKRLKWKSLGLCNRVYFISFLQNYLNKLVFWTSHRTYYFNLEFWGGRSAAKMKPSWESVLPFSRFHILTITRVYFRLITTAEQWHGSHGSGTQTTVVLLQKGETEGPAAAVAAAAAAIAVVWPHTCLSINLSIECYL